MMAIIKSKGVTPTERLLADICERSFLKLWSYPNPFKDDGDELCDLLAVFENQIFIFFDREGRQLEKSEKILMTNWDRWKRKVVDAQIRTAHGAERYIKSGRKIYLDSQLKVPFPLNIDAENLVVHKIVIAHGAKDACKQFSDDNIYGSLAIVYGKTDNPFPFMISLDKDNPVHVFDSVNLPIIFSELDTFFDFSAYLGAKIDAINSFDSIAYCGEEDLLAHYFLSFDETKRCHFIGPREEDINFFSVGEGEWKDFIELGVYKNKKLADANSYLWDKLIQKTCQNALDGTLLGDANLFEGKSAIYEMAKEPRFSRRALSEHMFQAMHDFPETDSEMMRNISFMPSYFEGTGYLFLQLKIDGIADYEGEYRTARRNMLEIACGAAKNKFPHLKKIIGIAIDAPKFTNKNSEDFILMECEDWPDDLRAHFEQANEEMGFFKSSTLTPYYKKVQEFPDIEKNHQKQTGRKKIGRNEKCPCGSGKKYKKCCIDK